MKLIDSSCCLGAVNYASGCDVVIESLDSPTLFLIADGDIDDYKSKHDIVLQICQSMFFHFAC